MDPLPDHMVKENDDNAVMLIGSKEFLQMNKEEYFQGYALIMKPKDEVKNIESLPIEVEELLRQYPSLVGEGQTKELPAIKSISHQIDLIPGETLPNKPIYKISS